MPEPARRSRRQRIHVALLVLVPVLVALVIAGKLAWPSLLRATVIKRAREQGVELDPGALSWKPGELRMRDPRFKLVGVEGVEGRAEAVVVALDGTTPLRVRARGVHLDATGDAAASALQMFEWTRVHATPAKLPVDAQVIAANVRSAAGTSPWLVAIDGAFESSESAWRFSALRVSVVGNAFEPVVASWKQGDKEIAIAVGSEDPTSAPVRLDVSREKPLTVKAQWKPMALSDLANMAGVRVGPRPITVGGKANMVWLVGGAVDGSVKVELKGFVPPHPRELDGLMFGDKTSLSSRFLVTPDRSQVTLGDVKLGAGSFLLTGGGHGQRVGRTATFDLQLTGPVACSALANSAAKGRLGNLIGGLVGDLAKRTLTGTLGVAVSVHADLGNLEGMTVKPSLSGRCGVKLLP